MIIRILFLTFFFISFSSASSQKVRIGNIDNYYKNKITKKELLDILNEIEYFLESKLNTNVFDYDEEGKTINLVYLPPSRLELRIENNIKKLSLKEKQINDLNKTFPQKQKNINKLKESFLEQNELLNKKVNKLNAYVKKVNKKKSMTKEEYKNVESYIQKEKLKLNTDLLKLKKDEKYLKRIINKFNKKVNVYNNLIRTYNNINNQLEDMYRNFKKIKGMTFGMKEIRLKTFYKDGKKIKEKNVKNSMNKIDIYGFDSLHELKVILSHEILHLVGIPHINTKNALMNSIIQKSQLENLFLTKEDIKNFKEHF